MTRRNMIWLIVVMLTAWLTWQTYQQESDMSVVNSIRTMTPSKMTGKALHPEVKLAKEGFYLTPRTIESEPFSDLFSLSVQLKQKNAEYLEQEEAPVAPALPFKYMGAVTQQNQTKFILDLDGEVMIVNAGDNLNINYKLVSIDKVANRTELVFLYLPMNLTQTMVVRDVSEH